MAGLDPRPSEILRARAQIDAARVRQQQLVASGKLAGPFIDGGLPKKTLPGYTLVRELHRGGQGVVYLGIQKSTDRQVAIKLLNRELPSRSGAAGLARFEREIEILSRLKHPNIVTVHDCGRDHGHVYLVMDYVIGRPLDAWVTGLEACDLKLERGDEPPGARLKRQVSSLRPSLADTLEVFARICDGVNAAHLRGVIHRDLKPSNILVDERGEPHVLDFGLAKLVEDSGDAFGGLGELRGIAGVTPTMTVTGQFVGSLPWASPEQAEGRTDSLDIRTDVYSLGVILYQLLTGQFPYPVSGRLSEVVHHIVESDPVRPSTIERTIDRELETILLKCLAKEPERRYQSAGDLARDIRRYLGGEAIEARRDSLVYVMAKRLARYRVVVSAAAAMLLVVLGALIVSIAFWRQAEHQGDLAQKSAVRADREAAQAHAITDFMREVLTSVEPENQGADVRLIEVLESASAEASLRFAGHPQQEAQVRELLGQIYDRLSMWAEAKGEFGRAIELWRRVAGPDDPRTLEVQTRYIHESMYLEQTNDAELALQDLMPRLERVHGPDDRRTLAARSYIAIAALKRNNVDEAERMLLDLRARPQLADDDPAQIRILSGLIAVNTNRLSTVEAEQLRTVLERAEPLALEWIQRSTRLNGPDSPSTLRARVKWAELSCGLGRYQMAAEACRGILDHSAGRLGECHDIRTNAMYTLAEALTGLGDHRGPAELQLQRLECLRQQLAPDNVVFLASVSDALRYVERAGRAAEGESLARELSNALQKIGGGHGEMGPATELFVAHFISMQNRLDEAEPMFRSLLARDDDFADSRVRGRVHLYYGSHLIRRGQFEHAESHLKTAAEMIGDVRVGTWDAYPDDIILGFITLYEAWNKPGKLQEYQRIHDELRQARPNL